MGQIYPLSVEADATTTVPLVARFETSRHSMSNSRAGSLIERATHEWREWFASVPQFECSDSYLTNAYWYRWYGLRLNAIEPQTSFMWPVAKHPAVCEGIAYFRNLISYSAHAHMRDLRWMHDPAFARGSLRNFLDNQKADGSFPGNLYATFRHDADMYHADWGRALLAVDELHPDAAFRAEAYAPLVRHARFYLDLRDREGSHLFDVTNQWETGQEYMHRYTVVDPNADGGGEMNPRLKGVDVTLYAYGLFVALAEIARELGNDAEADEWAAHATATEQAILTVMWDAEAGMFSDVNAGNDGAHGRPRRRLLLPVHLARPRFRRLPAGIARTPDEPKRVLDALPRSRRIRRRPALFRRTLLERRAQELPVEWARLANDEQPRPRSPRRHRADPRTRFGTRRRAHAQAIRAHDDRGRRPDPPEHLRTLPPVQGDGLILPGH